MNITVIHNIKRVQMEIDPASIVKYGICGLKAKATHQGQVYDVAKIHADTGNWWTMRTEASRTLKGPRDLNGEEPVSWVQS